MLWRRIRSLVERATSRSARCSRCARAHGEEGFTLIELLIVLVIMPMVIATIAIAIITTLKATDTNDPQGTAARLADSHDAQITSAYFVRDVESAQSVSTSSSPVCAPAGSANEQLLGLKWLTGGAQVYVSYFASTSPAELVRYYCSETSIPLPAVSTSVVSISVVSHDVFTGLTNTPTLLPPCPSSGFGSGASSCAWDSGPAAPAVYAAVTVNCNDGTSRCASNGPYLVSSTFTDGVSNTDYSWSSAAADFTSSDVGASITGAYIPTGTTIQSVTNSTPPTVVLSKKTTGSGSGLSFQLPDRGVKTVQLTVQVYKSLFTYSLTGTPRHANGSGAVAVSAPFAPPFITSGAVDTGNCTFLVNGVAAVNNSGTVSTGPKGSLQATGLYMANPPGSKSGNVPTNVVYGNPVPSPYAGLTEPPTSGSYPTYLESASNWDPSSLSQPLAKGIYIVQHGMSLKGGVNASNGVLFYVEGGSVDLGGNGNMNLSPLSPNWEGPTQPLPEVVVWISASDTSASLTLGGNGNATTINGAIYAPTASVTMNGGGNSGGINVQGFDVNSISCNGGGAVQWNLIAGSPLSSGSFDQPANPNITLGQSDTDSVTVTGAGQLAPTGTATVYECGPEVVATGCTSSTGTQVGSGTTLTPGANGTSTATSAPFTPSADGNWCFAAYYSGGVSYNSSSDTSIDGCISVSGPPAPSISYPTAGSYCTASGKKCSKWSGAITGTAGDAGGPGIASVQVSIEDPNGKWWNGTAFVTSATAVSNTATDTAVANDWSTWSYVFSSSSFPSGDTGHYTVLATSKDNNGVTGLPATATFTWKG